MAAKSGLTRESQGKKTTTDPFPLIFSSPADEDAQLVAPSLGQSKIEKQAKSVTRSLAIQRQVL